MKHTLTISLIVLIFLSSFYVYAAGISEIPQQTPTPTPTPFRMKSGDIPPIRNTNCDSIPALSDRIDCRLRNKQEGIDNTEDIDYEKQVPEACRTLKNPTACIALYKKVQQQKCYDLNGKEKDKCFKDIVGIKKKLSEENDRANKARQYLILLLYDLEERAENAAEEGKITIPQASGLVTIIVETKQLILDNKPKSDILPKLNELKEKWESLGI